MGICEEGGIGSLGEAEGGWLHRKETDAREVAREGSSSVEETVK